MKAMILAAGLGTRLKPFTGQMPKALVTVGGRPMLEILIRRLMAQGIREMIINVHHFADQVIDYLAKNQNFGAGITISREEMLLETGGGLKKASWFFGDGQPFLMHNVDVISDLNFSEMREQHLRSGALATLAVTRRTTSRCFLFDADLNLRGWMNASTGEQRLTTTESVGLQPLAFSGVQLISPEFFDFFPAASRFPIIETYLDAARQRTIKGFVHDAQNWLDMGKPDELGKAAQLLGRLEL
jgi:NDP-sugar pyrophosphorylase family protein